MPRFDASAISCMAPVIPPSVGSCMACTPPVVNAVMASFTMLIRL